MLFTRTYKMSVAALAVAVLWMPAAWCGYARVNTPNPNDPMAVAIYRLDNGLTVYLTENHESPRFYAEIAVRAGSKFDPAETTGLAHYFEHLMFKGSQRLGTLDYAAEKPFLDYVADLYEIHFGETDPEKRDAIYAQINEASVKASQWAVPNELDRVYNAMGGVGLNAHTSDEETVYKIDLPSNRLGQWAEIESDRFNAPVFRLFQTELETVYEEMNRALDNKMFMISTEVDKALFKHHPYGQQPTLGIPEHLKNPSLYNIAKFFQTYYVPNNMAICISGDINTEEAIRVIDAQFSGLPPRDLPELKTWEESPLHGREYVECRYEGEEYVLLGFRTAPNHDADAEALIVLDMILDNAAAGLINLDLNQAQLVREAGSFPRPMNDYGAQYLWGIPKEGQALEEVESLLLAELDKVRRGEFEDWILPAIVNDLRKQIKGGLEDNNARVSMMRDAFISLDDWDHAVDHLARIERVTKEDVMRVAAAYFSRGYVAGYRVDAPHEVPKVEKPELAVINIDPNRSSAFGQEVAAREVTPIEPVFVDPAKDYVRAEDPDGVVLYYAPNHVNDLFGLTLNIDFGKFQDDRIGVAAALLDKSGTERLSPEDLQKEWYKLGTSFGVGVGDNDINFSISGLDENFAASFALLMECVTKPQADPAVLDVLKEILLKQREDSQKQAETLGRALFLYNRYGEESPYLRRLSGDEIRTLTVDELFALVRALPGYKHRIFYTGSIPADKLQETLRAARTPGVVLQDPPPYRFLRARAPEQTEIYFLQKETAQAQVRLEFGDVDFDETLTPGVQLYNEYFSGSMAGVVFQELREARALAYSAGAQYVAGSRLGEQNMMFGAIGTQADKTVEAVRAFLDLLENLPVSEDRFAIAKDSLVNLYRTGKIGFREIPGIVRNWELHGLAADPRRERYPRIAESTVETLLQFHRDRIAGRQKLISIVGDKAKIDLNQLGSVAPVKEIGAEQLFRN